MQLDALEERIGEGLMRPPFLQQVQGVHILSVFRDYHLKPVVR